MGKITITEDIFLERFSHSKNKDKIKIIGKYNGYGKRIECECLIDGYKWSPFAYNIACGSGCPVCNNDIILVGVNDLWTTHPKIAEMLKNPDDGYKVTHGSSIKLEWLCPDCGRPRIDTPNNVKKFGVRCSNCNDNVSFPNKIVYNLLWQLEENFFSEKSFDFSINKNGNKCFYDFYIPDKNIIIEVNGAQHYERQIHYDARTVKEEQENDLYKMQLALNNGFEKDKYIVIDARYAEFNYIKNNILSSNLSNYYDLRIVDWDKVFFDSIHSLMNKAADLWNENKTTQEIATIMHKNVNSTISLLKNASKLNLCDYSPELSNKKRDDLRKKKIICLEDLTIYDCGKDFENKTNILRRTVECQCRKNSAHEVNGKHYFYLEDFISKSVNEIAELLLKPNHGGSSGCVTPIYCIEADMIFNTKKEASLWGGTNKKYILEQMRGQRTYAGIHSITHKQLHWRKATIDDAINYYSLYEKKNKLKELKYA